MKRIIAFILGITVVLFSGCAIDEQPSFGDSIVEEKSSSSIETESVFYNIYYKAVIEKKITDIPTGMFDEKAEYPKSCAEHMSLSMPNLKDCVVFDEYGGGIQYIFTGWFVDEMCMQTFTPIDQISDDITLYAKITCNYWTPNA